MADPLSILGAATGVTSLIIQLTDECVKGYKLYREAADLPQSYGYLLVRLQIEQHRFLTFALEAGILNVDGLLCSTLQVKRSLLLAILAEIKLSFESFAAENGKYEKTVTQSAVSKSDHTGPDIDLIDFICIVASNNTRPEREALASKRAEAAKRLRGLKDSIVQTAKNLRIIVVEPKRLVWAAVGKDAFEQLVSKLGSLNAFLISLLDSSQFRRLEEFMSTAYLEILQLRNDVGDLAALVKALAPAAENQPDVSAVNPILVGSTLSQAVGEQAASQRRKESYLRRLAEIKIQFTKINSLSNNNAAISDFGKYIDDPLPLSSFKFADGALVSDDSQQRTVATYQGGTVWIEWRGTPVNGPASPDDRHVQWRIGLLTDLLRSAKPESFRAAPCLGYIKVPDVDGESRFGVVFEEPLMHGAEPKITTLRELLDQQPQPSLSARMSLCAVLARCIHSLHAVNWLHKALRPDNIIFVSSGSPNLSQPLVSGFELSRPSLMEQLTEKPGFDPLKDIYRHPNAQSSQADGNYRKSYDVYSLGILMIEVALWKLIKDVVGLKDLAKAMPSTLRLIQPCVLGRSLETSPSLVPAESRPCLQQVASACGDSFRDVVERCLKLDDIEKPEYRGEQEAAIALRVQRLTDKDIVQELERVASSV